MVYPFKSDVDARWFEDYVLMTGYEYKEMLSVSRHGRMVDVRFYESGYPVIKEITQYYLACREAQHEKVA